MTRFWAVVTTLSILAFIAIYVGLGAGYLGYGLAGLALLGLVLLLTRVFVLASADQRWSRSIRFWMQAHVVLHLVPLSYLLLQFFTDPTLQLNMFYLLPVLSFFYSGRQTWRVFFEQFGSKMYRIFFLGNTGMMVGHVLLISLGLLMDVKFGTAFFCRALLTYFTIHMLILGFAVVKIEDDLRSTSHEAV